jgi:hypothetical protein
MNTPPTAAERRTLLLEEMRRLAEDGKTCLHCSGLCCTSLANSMRISPQEALDIRDALLAEQRWNDALAERLRDTIRRFRLDQELGDGRRVLRRSYTCPFFSGARLGCTLPPTHKPYGCLAFNPHRPGLREGGDCSSDQALLQRRENAFPPDASALSEPIPVAVLRLYENLSPTLPDQGMAPT